MGVPGIVVLVLIMLSSGVALGLSLQRSGGRTADRGATASSVPSGSGWDGLAAAAGIRMAAEWISQQVSRGTIVACDAPTCSSLEANGVPATNLLVLRNNAVSLRGAELVVATPAVVSMYGSRLDGVYAPAVIARFGSGQGQVDVRLIAPDGAAAYRSALRQDVAARKTAGTQLLGNDRIDTTVQARMKLVAGEVDSRLLIMLPVLATTHPIRILAFGDPGPGANQGIPLCSVDLSRSGQAAGMSDASYTRWLAEFVRAQLFPYTATIVTLRRGGQGIVRVEVSRPSPLGLLPYTG